MIMSLNIFSWFNENYYYNLGNFILSSLLASSFIVYILYCIIKKKPVFEKDEIVMEILLSIILVVCVVYSANKTIPLYMQHNVNKITQKVHSSDSLAIYDIKLDSMVGQADSVLFLNYVRSIYDGEDITQLTLWSNKEEFAKVVEDFKGFKNVYQTECHDILPKCAAIYMYNNGMGGELSELAQYKHLTFWQKLKVRFQRK